MYQNITKPILEWLYLKEGLSSYSIAKELGCSPRTIRERLQKYNIPTRSFGNKPKDIYLNKGYVFVKISPSDPFYPMCSWRHIAEHRLVMARHLGRCLKPWEIVHHRGTKYPQGSIENRGDNRIENLELLPSQAKHLEKHLMADRIKWLEQRVTQLETELVLLKAQQPLKIEW